MKDNADVYDLISVTVEKFKQSDRERFFAKLDAPFTQEVNARKDHALLDRLEAKPAHEEEFGKDDGNTIDIVVNHLKDALPSKELDILLNIVEKGGYTLRVAAKDFSMHLPEIKEKLREIADRFRDSDGRLMIPPRPVRGVQFNPFRVEFGRRNFYGNPGALLESHKEVYEGMGRRELYEFDHGLYRALVKSNQINRIPRRVRDFRGDPLSYYLENGERYKGKTRQELFRADPGLYHCLLRKGQLRSVIPERIVWNKLPLYKEELIVKTLKANKLNIRRTAAELGVDEETVRKYGILHNALAQDNSKRLRQEDVARIISTLRSNQGDAMQAARALGVNQNTVRKYAKRNGIPLQDMRKFRRTPNL